MEQGTKPCAKDEFCSEISAHGADTARVKPACVSQLLGDIPVIFSAVREKSHIRWTVGARVDLFNCAVCGCVLLYVYSAVLITVFQRDCCCSILK